MFSVLYSFYVLIFTDGFPTESGMIVPIVIDTLIFAVIAAYALWGKARSERGESEERRVIRHRVAEPAEEENRPERDFDDLMNDYQLDEDYEKYRRQYMSEVLKPARGTIRGGLHD